MKKYLNVILIFLITASGIFAQKKLTLEQAIAIALQRNSALIKARNNLLSSKAELKSAYGALLPNLSASSSWNWRRISDNGGKQIDFFGNEITIPPSRVDSRNYSLSTGGSWVIFDGLANLANIKSAKNQLKSAKLQLRKQKEDIVLKTIQYYYKVLSAKELLRVREENVKYNKKLLETIELKNKLGSVAVSDVYSQKVQLGNAQLLEIQARNDYENAKSNLLNYLALNILDDYELVDTNVANLQGVESQLKDFKNLRKMVRLALTNRPDYKSQLFAYKSRVNQITIAKGSYLPSLSGNFSFATSATNPNNLFNRRVYFVGLNLRIPIFSNFNTERSVELAKIGALNAREDLQALKRQIRIEIQQTYLNLIAAKKQLDVSIANVKSALENRRINRERYNLGSATILDVLQSDRDYTQAIQNKISAEYSYYQLRFSLLNAMGKLDYKIYE